MSVLVGVGGCFEGGNETDKRRWCWGRQWQPNRGANENQSQSGGDFFAQWVLGLKSQSHHSFWGQMSFFHQSVLSNTRLKWNTVHSCSDKMAFLEALPHSQIHDSYFWRIHFRNDWPCNHIVLSGHTIWMITLYRNASKRQSRHKSLHDEKVWWLQLWLSEILKYRVLWPHFPWFLNKCANQIGRIQIAWQPPFV